MFLIVVKEKPTRWLSGGNKLVVGTIPASRAAIGWNKNSSGC